MYFEVHFMIFFVRDTPAPGCWRMYVVPVVSSSVFVLSNEITAGYTKERTNKREDRPSMTCNLNGN